MNKKTAKEMAYAGNVTYGQLQDLLNSCDTSKPCKINKNITRTQMIEIMSLAIKDKPPEDKPNTTWFNHNEKLTLTSDGLTVMNILHECG